MLKKKILFQDAARLDPQHIVEDERMRLREAVTRVRNLQNMAGVPISFIPENLPAASGAHLWDYIADMQPIMVMSEFGSESDGSEKRIGVPKTQCITADMYFKFVEVLYKSNVCFSMQFSSLPRAGTDGTQMAKDLLFNDMATYRPGEKQRISDKGHWDLLISLMMIIYWRQKLLCTARYQKWIRENVRQHNL